MPDIAALSCTMPPEAPFSRSHRVFGGLDGTGPYNLACRLGLEHHRLAVERVCALACLGCGLLDDDELCQSRNKKHAGLFQFLVTDVRERIGRASCRERLSIYGCGRVGLKKR